MTTVRPQPIPIAPADLTGRIVFSQESDVWVMNADGGERSQLTSDPAADFDPVWSPDGTQIAFRSHRDGNEEVYVMDSDGGNVRNVTRNGREDEQFPAWSPDGRYWSSAATAA